MECLRFFVSGQTWACGLLASEAAAHNLKGERAPVALCREPTEASAETVGSNPAPATTSRQTLVVRRIFLRKMRLHRSGCRSSPQKVSLRLHCSLASALTTFRLATNFLQIFPLFRNQEQAELDALPVPLFPSRQGRATYIRRSPRSALLFSNTLLVKRHITGFCWMVGNEAVAFF